jgi:calcineurin-like phosphoesterase family protein
MRFFTSDTHFYDYDTLLLDDRPFSSAEEFDDFVIDTWNTQAKKSDTIFVIGDFVDCDGKGYEGWKHSINYVKRINAEVVLIVGNNEERVIKNWFDNNFDAFRDFCLKAGFKDVHKNLILNVCDTDFFLTHKPKDRKEGMLTLFGHLHRSCGLYKPYGFNIGCDLNHFRLYDENNIKKFLDMKKEYWDKNPSLQ